MKFLLFFLPLLAQAESFYFVGVPTIKNGYYQDMEESQTALHLDQGGLVRLCGFSKYKNGQKGYFWRRFSHIGHYLYSGRDRVGTFEDNKILVEQKLPEDRKSSLLLQWNPENKTYIYAMKHPVLGGFQVEGQMKSESSIELDEACEREH